MCREKAIVWTYGDVSGMRFLLAKGESLESLGENLRGRLHHQGIHFALLADMVERGEVGLDEARRKRPS